MAKSARRAVALFLLCIGLAYKDQPFIHPKTKSCRSLAEALVEEIGKHPTLSRVKFSSIKINHNTISALPTDAIVKVSRRWRWGSGISKVDGLRLGDMLPSAFEKEKSSSMMG